MNEDFVSFSLAKKLKKKGFNKRVCGYYRETGGLSICNTPMNSNALENEFSAPTISQVLKWLREEKKIHVAGGYSAFSKWRYVVMFLDERATTEPTFSSKRKESYEQAALAGIEYCLNNLI